jgi:hypothetical protein
VVPYVLYLLRYLFLTNLWVLNSANVEKFVMKTGTELRYRPGTSAALNIKVKLNWLEGQIKFC